MSTALQRTRMVLGAEAAPRVAVQPAERAPDLRPPLEVVAPRTGRVRRRRLAPLLSSGVVTGSLLFVVIGHAELAQGQMRLTSVQAEITSARLLHQREVLSLAKLENPSRILRVAEDTLHMAAPSQVHQLAHVTVGAPLPPPHVAVSTGSTPAQRDASSG
jgi:hypothetical protein